MDQLKQNSTTSIHHKNQQQQQKTELNTYIFFFVCVIWGESNNAIALYKDCLHMKLNKLEHQSTEYPFVDFVDLCIFDMNSSKLC